VGQATKGHINGDNKALITILFIEYQPNALLNRAGREQNREASAAFHGVGSI
jgi:hypothetical protein